jgi:very-short-patch-repair endonuclease
VNNWNALREHYARHAKAIAAAARNDWAIDPYAWDVRIMQMTPIEAWLWQDIRDANAVLYPQYPVGGVFVDFASPRAKVAIECDGADFHLDKAKDQARDAKLAAMGWTVYRFTGRECRQEFNPDTRTASPVRLALQQIAERHRLIVGRD